MCCRLQGEQCTIGQRKARYSLHPVDASKGSVWSAHGHLEVFELAPIGIAAGGKAMGKAPDGRVVFVSYGIPGERVVAEVTEMYSQYLEARTVRVLRPSPARVETSLSVFWRLWRMSTPAYRVR